MFFLDVILSFIRGLISWFVLPFFGPAADSARDDASLDRDRTPADRLDMREDFTQRNADDLEHRSRAVQSVIITQDDSGRRSAEDHVTDSFLAQLEQRTQQVKITLANLEAEKTRIEAQIAQLQPIVPHYDALLEAERAIAGAQIAFDATGAVEDQPSAADEGEASDAAATAESEAAMGEPTAQGSNWTSYNP